MYKRCAEGISPFAGANFEGHIMHCANTGCSSSNSGQGVVDRGEQIVCYSDCKHLHQRLLSALYNFLSLSNKDSCGCCTCPWLIEAVQLQ